MIPPACATGVRPAPGPIPSALTLPYPSEKSDPAVIVRPKVACANNNCTALWTVSTGLLRFSCVVSAAAAAPFT